MMDCRQIRQYLFAFADGQLDIKDNCELLDHLKMCPACTRAVDEHQATRVHVRRMLDTTAVPATLADRITHAVAADRSRRPRMPINWRKTAPAALAAAACLLLAVNAVLEFTNRGSAGSPESHRGQAMARSVGVAHDVCCDSGVGHHNPKLARDARRLRGQFAEEFEASSTFASIVPDFRKFDYQIESASFCEVRNLSRKGGHVIYAHNDTKRQLSFFCIPNLSWTRKCGEQSSDPDGWFDYSPEQDDGTKLHVLAWTDGDTTYVCCSPIEADRMKDMVEDYRQAMSTPKMRSIMASIWAGD